jgi:UDP-glucose 4-epimerase
MKILVTGGAGYIGSHVIRALKVAGHEPIALDDLTSGKQVRLGDTPLVQIDLASPGATEVLIDVFREYEVSGVIHLAARKSVGESVEKPEYYYQQNLHSVTNLLVAMRAANVMNMVFSSSAATYGSPDVPQVDEDYNCRPINPYGETKLIGEWMMAAANQSWGLRTVSLRYFNVAGAGFEELADTAVANLIPIAFNAIANKKAIQIFGSDWPTPDGSCVRDYIHVQDLADAHISALEYLSQDSREHSVFNVGTGTGSSVLEVIQSIRDVTGLEFEVDLVPRRPGDPAALSADDSRIEKTLGWKAKHTLDDIVSSHYRAISKQPL